MLLTDTVHGIAGFLPWHRYFGQVYEDALRECGYKGVATLVHCVLQRICSDKIQVLGLDSGCHEIRGISRHVAHFGIWL